MKIKSITKQELLELFQKIDTDLTKQHQPVSVTVLGGASIILLGFRERATIDIDIAPSKNARLFESICKHYGLPVDIITIASTVDLHHCSSVTVFQGSQLTVASVTAEDLIRLKLERFRKQDPEDIYAIIQHEGIDYERFKEIAIDMLPDYIGNERELKLSALVVVEQLYADYASDFQKAVRL